MEKKQVYSFMEDIFCENPEEAKVAYMVLNNLKKGKYDSKLVNAIFQDQSWEYDIVDAFYFGKIYVMLKKGSLSLKVVTLGETPSKDNQVKENNKKLQNLKECFSISFKPTDGRDELGLDGVLNWSEDLTVNNITGSILINSNHVPLEVGYTKAYTTFFHIQRDGGVARWAYNSDEIFIFIKK